MRSHESYVECGRKGAEAKWSKEPPFDVRFWRRVDIKSEDECWPWMRSLAKTGYGKVKRFGKHTNAHRVAFELSNGPIIPGRYVLHHCDNRPCCNPKHLYQGTPADNNRDAKARNRYPKTHRRLKTKEAVGKNISEGIRRAAQAREGFGPNLTTRIVTDNEIHLIRSLASQHSQTKLASMFGFDQSTISRIIHSKGRFAGLSNQ